MKKEFKYNEKTYYVVSPNPRQINESHVYYAKACKKALENGLIFQDKLDEFMRSGGLWDDKKEAKKKELEKFLRDGQETLEVRGGIKKSDAKKLALEMIEKRYEYLDLISERNRLTGITVESTAERERVNYLISVCSKDENGVNVFKNLEDYVERSDDDLSVLCAQYFAMIYAGWDEDVLKKLPENKFLIKYGFMNDKMEMVGEEVKEEEKIEFVEFTDD